VDRRNKPARNPFFRTSRAFSEGTAMNGIIYLVGLVVVVMAILSLFGLR
jgi:hypothetical protein